MQLQPQKQIQGSFASLQDDEISGSTEKGDEFGGREEKGRGLKSAPLFIYWWLWLAWLKPCPSVRGLRGKAMSFRV